jgi:LuxR family maltose regulon positive regulatory protein
MLLRSMGSTPSLFVISRTRPRLPLDVLSAYGEVAVLQAADLQFSPDESRALVCQAAADNLTSEAIDRIVERAGGWAVGLRLLAASSNLIETIDGSDTPGTRAPIDPELSDYLFSEVIDQQPEDVQDFLLRTSILEFLHADFCNTLTGRADSLELLDRLAAEDLFTQVVDRTDRTYRYHPLFREALASRQERTLTPDAIAALHRAAAIQYQAIDSFEWAAHHHILAGDWDVALELVHRQAATWMLEDHLPSLEAWTGRFPLAVLLRDPFLVFCRLWALGRLGRPAQAERLIALARERSQRGDDRFFDLRLDLIETYLAILRSDYESALRLCRAWLDGFPWKGTLEHLAFMMYESLASLFAGQPLVANASLERTRQLIESSGRAWLDSLESSFRGRILMMRGQNVKAKAVFKQAVYLGERANAQPLHYAHLLLAQASLESMELRSARSNAVRCLELAGTIGTSVHSSPALQVLADVATVRGDRHEAEQHIRQAIAIARQLDLTGQLMDAEARQAHYLISSGDADGATTWSESRLAQTIDPMDYRQYQENAVVARYLIVTGRIPEAETIVRQLFEEARGNNRRRDEFEMAALGALARWCAGDELGAIARFRPALRRASENQWVFTLMQDVQLFAPMLERLSDDVEIGGFVGGLLRERRDRLHLRVVLDSTGSPLTPRERDMLSGLLTGKSNRELAEEMFISEYTVKRHLSNLYTKLGVSSRAQAIAFFSNRGEG